MRKNTTSDEVRGSPEFIKYLSGLAKESECHQRILNGLKLIKENMLIGNKIEKKKWPRGYVRKYRIHNLFRIKTGKESRLVYTIIAEGEKKIVIILDFFPKHKDYERCFGYY